MKYSYIKFIGLAISLLFNTALFSQIKLEKEVKITDLGLFFNGTKNISSTRQTLSEPYDFAFGPQISVHGDCVFTFEHYVFMTWYKGGKENRHMMLTRYNQKTGTQQTIEFPHRHTGFRNQWWIGESHNTIGIGVSPLDGTIHLLFDMHAYSKNRPEDGSLSKDYFRYAYSVKNAANVPDDEFTLDLFVKDKGLAGDYTHLSLNGVEDHGVFSEFTYPKFFLNDGGELFFSMRKGASPNGGYHFAKYDAATSKWSNFVKFADRNAKNHGVDYNWGMYGRLQYLNGKIRIGFQRRLQNTTDKYLYQNGIYYAYSDDQSGQSQWKNYKGEGISVPLRDADNILVYEPGDLLQTTQKDKVYMVGGFDWTVTNRGDVHFIARVKDNQFNITKNVHTYKPAGDSEFITTTNFSGGSELYTSGNNIYLIGLNSSGRVLIQRSEGGKNNFTKVYEATSGKRFRHGVVYINDGKLYYYLLERGSSDTQPIYLQIIDLDIQKEATPFTVNLQSPRNEQTIKKGAAISLIATATIDEGEIKKVAFLVNGNVVNEDIQSPYFTSWTATETGSFKLKAVAYKSGGESLSSSEVRVEVKEIIQQDLTQGIYRLKNVVSGMYLTSLGSEITASNSSEGKDKQWTFVNANMSGTKEFFNIDSEVKGTIRFKGGASNPELVSTSFGAPNTNVDKIWTIIFNEDGSYSFETRDHSRYLYHSEDGTVTHSSKNDNRGKWFVESTTLSSENEEVFQAEVKIYPNPAKKEFTIYFKNSDTIKNVEIYNVLGKIIYRNSKISNLLKVNTSNFTSGIYFVKASLSSNKSLYLRLMVK